jgi:steroid delta-isomerase-like uncharacterized protein
MTRDEIAALFSRRVAAWERKDAIALAADHAEDAIAESPVQGRIVGRARIQQVYGDWMRSFPDLSFTQNELLVDGAQIAQFFKIRGTHTAPFGGIPAMGRRFEINGVLLFTLGPGDLFVHELRLYDVTKMLMQLGVLKGSLTDD